MLESQADGELTFGGWTVDPRKPFKYQFNGLTELTSKDSEQYTQHFLQPSQKDEEFMDSSGTRYELEKLANYLKSINSKTTTSLYKMLEGLSTTFPVFIAAVPIELQGELRANSDYPAIAYPSDTKYVLQCIPDFSSCDDSNPLVELWWKTRLLFRRHLTQRMILETPFDEFEAKMRVTTLQGGSGGEMFDFFRSRTNLMPLRFKTRSDQSTKLMTVASIEPLSMSAAITASNEIPMTIGIR